VTTSGDGTTAVSIDTKVFDALNEVSTDTVSGPNTTSQTTTESYDLNGNLVRTLEPNALVQFHGYDLANQQTSLELDAGSPNTASGVNPQKFTYDNDLLSSEGTGDSETLRYDGANRLTHVVTGPTFLPSYDFGYNSAGMLTSLTTTVNGTPTTITYTHFGMVQSCQRP
jgi:uncharacterized protein RhaS with RHS repeats